MMNILLLECLLLVAVQAVPHSFSINGELNDEWETYKKNFGKQYESLTEIARRIIWEKNHRYIQQHNLEYALGKHTYYLGLNEHADTKINKFKGKYLGRRVRTGNRRATYFVRPWYLWFLPGSVDWSTQGYVTPVKNQGQCGSCWAFSATGSLEGHHFRKTGNLISFSEQQLVDCSVAYGNNGCDGGWNYLSFEYIKQFGIESEASYGYTATNGTCKFDRSKVVGTVTGHLDIRPGNEGDLAAAVATIGPVSVSIDASSRAFDLYKGGIYNQAYCSTTSLNHAVLVVGYGSENGKNFWLVKNSWGTSWGLSGYIKMSKDAHNQCGIATDALYPLV